MNEEKRALSEDLQALLDEIGSLPPAGDDEQRKTLEDLAAAMSRLTQTVEAFKDQEND